MQRQSLGSPSSKHHLLLLSHASIQTTTITTTSPLTSPSSSQTQPDDLNKTQKKLLHRRPAEKFIHAIPLLTLLCFLILYLSSHNPSQLEMDMFNGFKTLHDPIDSVDEKGDLLSIRSLRNLQEIDKEEGSNYQQLHRKIMDF